MRGNSAKPSARVCPSMTRARTPSTMLCTRGFSVCWDTASSDSSSGNHARTAVVADRRGAEARVALDLLLGDPVVDHGAHGIIDDDELVDPGAAAVAAGVFAP